MEILDRAHTGPVMEPETWDSKIVREKATEVVREHRLADVFDRNKPINIDDGLADEFYKAGFELAVELGLLCMSTQRLIKVTEEELKDAVRSAPSRLQIGEGNDASFPEARKPEDGKRPTHHAPMCVSSEDIWIPLMTGIAQLPEVDALAGGSLVTVYGREMLSGTPYELLGGILEARLRKEAIWRAGRPGMGTEAVSSSATHYGQLGGYGMPDGYDPRKDIALVLCPSELKVAYDSFFKIVHAITCKGRINASCPTFYAGYVGGAENAVVVNIASCLLLFPIGKSSIANSGLYDVRYAGNCGREAQWCSNMIIQALSRNTHTVVMHIISETAGPCTEMLLLETAVDAMSASSSGTSIMKGPRPVKGKLDYITPLECKFEGEVLRACSKMKRTDANEIAKRLIPLYEQHLLNAPMGKSFRECYDLAHLKPSDEWLGIYRNVKKKLIDLGVPLED